MLVVEVEEVEGAAWCCRGERERVRNEYLVDSTKSVV